MHEPRMTVLGKLSSHGSIKLCYTVFYLSFIIKLLVTFLVSLLPSCISAIITSYLINPITMHKLHCSSLTLHPEVVKYLYGALPLFVSLTVDQMLKKFLTSYGIL
jgi:hypothetical protein